MHPLIPNQNGSYCCAEQIHLDCTNEMYTWCHVFDYECGSRPVTVAEYKSAIAIRLVAIVLGRRQ